MVRLRAHRRKREFTYGLAYRDSTFVPRRDGFVFQVTGNDDYYGYGIDTTAPDRVEAEHAIQTIQSLFPPG